MGTACGHGRLVEEHDRVVAPLDLGRRLRPVARGPGRAAHVVEVSERWDLLGADAPGLRPEAHGLRHDPGGKGLRRHKLKDKTRGVGG